MISLVLLVVLAVDGPALVEPAARETKQAETTDLTSPLIVAGASGVTMVAGAAGFVVGGIAIGGCGVVTGYIFILGGVVVPILGVIAAVVAGIAVDAGIGASVGAVAGVGVGLVVGYLIAAVGFGVVAAAGGALPPGTAVPVLGAVAVGVGLSAIPVGAGVGVALDERFHRRELE